MSKLFQPNGKVSSKVPYFQVNNQIFDSKFIVRAFKRYKENGNFVKDKFILEYRNINIFERCTYMYLCRKGNNGGDAFPSYQTIADAIGCSRSKAIEAVETLFDNGFISKEKRYKTNKEFTSNEYIVNAELEKLVDALKELYKNQETIIVTKKEKELMEQESSNSLSDKSPSMSDTPPSSMSDTPPSMSDTPKQKQSIKNNISYKKTHNNCEKNKSVVVLEKVKSIFDEQITNLEAKKLLDASQNNINLIKDKYKLSKHYNSINNVVGWVISAIKLDYKEPRQKKAQGSFTDYEQRNYDFDDLEKKLLGWDN